MKEQTQIDREHESVAAKKAWEELLAEAKAGNKEAEEKVKRVREAVYMEYNS